MRHLTCGLAALFFSAGAMAQERSLNDGGTSGALRTWAPSGVWQVALMPAGKGYTCLIATGKDRSDAHENYLWGVAKDEERFSLFVMDRNHAATRGESLLVTFDRVPFGGFRTSARKREEGFEIIRSDLAKDQAESILRLLALSSQVKFSTQNATYSATLEGFRSAATKLGECSAQAIELARLRQTR